MAVEVAVNNRGYRTATSKCSSTIILKFVHLQQGSHSHGKVMENDWSWKSHGKLLVMEKSWNSVGHGKSHGKPKFGQIYFVDFVELRALKEFLNFAINIFNHISTF